MNAWRAKSNSQRCYTNVAAGMVQSTRSHNETSGASKVAALAACFRVHCKEARLCQDRKCFQLPGCHLPDEIVDLAESRPQFLRRSNKASVQKRSCARVLT